LFVRFRPPISNKPWSLIGVPDREYHAMSLAVVDNSFWWRTNVQGPGRQRLESIDLGEVDFFSVDRHRAKRHYT
jgi:hypothetical protein